MQEPHNLLNSFCVVLVEPQLAVNIGTVVRAMKNMGLTRLRLVNPCPDVDLERTQIAAHRTTDIVEDILIFDTLAEALADCHRSVGLTARPRKREWIVSTPRESAARLLQRAADGQTVALVFGRERSGLSNEELSLCDEFLTVPTRADYSSLNLAQAVILCAYELFMASDQARPVSNEPRVPASSKLRERLLAQSRHTLSAIGFFKSHASAGVLHTLARIFSRAELDTSEAQMLIGVFVEVLKFADLIRRGILDPADLPDATVHIPPDSEEG